MAATKSLVTPKTRKLFANRFIREEEEREILSRDCERTQETLRRLLRFELDRFLLAPWLWPGG